ncbi:MAG: DUF3857 domain-containing protein [Flavobacterium sp.]|nr:MAG: DUF3857 domain-containing protein [Flavobacterium sp.]
MKRIVFRFFFLAQSLFAIAQDNYDVDLIPANLRPRANAIVRNKETIVDMKAVDNVMLNVKQAITVFNKNGEDAARLVIFYDKNRVIKGIKGEVYNELGKPIGKFSQSDFKDESAGQDFSLFEDSRVKHYLPLVNTFPYTVVYNYEIRVKQNLIIPDWVPKPAVDVAVEKSSYTFICKPDEELRIKAQKIAEAEEKVDEKQKTYTWKVSNLLAVKPEPFSPISENYQTSVKIAPQKFSYFRYNGSYSNWQELGKWYYDSLLKDRQTLSPTTIQAIKDLIKDEVDDKAKAKKIYEYMQQKTRYISIQIGIGGFQPFSAAEVDRLGYGDCKALVNYMQSLLAVANIESYYCVVYAGTQKVSLDATYASMNQANHIILCMPLNGDTTWLECTSQKIPFGFLSDFTDDRVVLACTKDGGKLLRTPKLTTQNNLQVRKADLILDEAGNVSGSLQTIFSGSQYDNRQDVLYKSFIEQQKGLKEDYDVNNIYFDKIEYLQQKDIDPKLTENLKINVRNYVSINNNKMLFEVNAFNVQNTISDSKNRVLPVYINRGFTDIDTVTYQLPKNVLPIVLPITNVYKNDFGSYESKAYLKDGKLVYCRKMVLNDGTYPANSYELFHKFVTDINTADHLKIILSLKK